jgi:hypothetical protein
MNNSPVKRPQFRDIVSPLNMNKNRVIKDKV